MRTLILFWCSFPAFGAINATVQWDVRTTGSNSNGGGFDPQVTSPGTDQSQGNSGTSYTDIVIGSTTTQATSILHPFSSTTNGPGNLVNITGGSGCTTGWFEELSQSGGTATFDRSLGSAASVCTAVLGGSLATVQQANTNAVNSNIVWLQAGTFTLTAGLNINVSELSWIGYTTTHGDASTPVATITTSTNSIAYLIYNGIQGLSGGMFRNITISSTAGTPGIGFNADNNAWYGLFLINSKVSGFTHGIDGNYGLNDSFPYLTVINTEITGCTIGLYNTAPTIIWGSYIHDNTSHGAEQAGGGGVQGNWTVKASVFYNNGGIGLYLGGTNNSYTVENSVFMNNTSDGLSSPGSTYLQVPITIYNNVFYGNGGYGVNFGGLSPSALPRYGLIVDNAFRSNTSGNYNLGLLGYSVGVSLGDITLTANPFTSAGVFTLNSTAGGGALLKAAGFPGVTPAGTGYLDIGALQSQAATGGAAPHPFAQ